MFTKKKFAGFSLIELLIAVSIFAVVAMIAGTFLINGLRTAKKIGGQVLLYNEAQALMDQVARDVERNAIDYEAYYSRAVHGDTGWETPRYGEYAQSFYNPGTGGTQAGPYEGIGGYGIACPDGEGSYPTDCPGVDYEDSQKDTVTGQHPFVGVDEYSGYDRANGDSMNAFCEDATGGSECSLLSKGVQEELILVNGAGDERTVYRPKPMADGSEMALARMELSGTDTNNDGLVDTWKCDSKYACSADAPELSDFAKLSPNSVAIEDFYVVISPFEDPYRAFDEIDMQVQPQVTIVMKLRLSEDYSRGLLGEVPSILVQRTVSTGVYAAVPSYE